MKLGWLRLFSLPVAMALVIGLPAAPAVAAADNQYTVHPLVLNVAGMAPNTDPNLVNAWGLTASATSPWWVADNGTSVSTLYRADGSIVPLVVQVPVHPTGTVFWGAARATFVFDTEAGQIRGWRTRRATRPSSLPTVPRSARSTRDSHSRRRRRATGFTRLTSTTLASISSMLISVS